ncbi:MAG: hypothetical protein V1777_05740 [Candidatus Micrarchaeota archaeon]
MKKNVLTVEIKRPVEAVFQFCINPANTPKWISSILEEKTDKPHVGLGTIYSQKVVDSAGKIKKTSLVITGFFLNKQLDFHLANSQYTCSYRFDRTPAGTRLTYSEENGIDNEIEAPLKQENLRVLKRLIEK